MSVLLCHMSLFICHLCLGGVHVELQYGDVTNSEMCCRGHSSITAVCVLVVLLPVISAVCVLAAAQGQPSSLTEQLVNWQPPTEQLVN